MKTSQSTNKNDLIFLLLEGIHSSAFDTLKNAGYNKILCVDHALSENELKEKVATANILGVRSRTQLTKDVLQVATNLIGIGCFCIGTNQVDLQSSTSKGIPVFNAPYSNTRSVAELVLAEAIFLLRGIAEKNMALHQGVWTKSISGAREIRGKTLGVIGYGNIGSQLSILAEALGMRVVFYDTAHKLPIGNATSMDTLNQLLSSADVVSLHVPETQSTINLIGEPELAQMKPESVLINASRGLVVDIDALESALNRKALRGAALDVFPTEPATNSDSFISNLQGFNNVILTPHIGGSTIEAQENIGREVAEKLIMYCHNGSTLSSVNFPEVILPEHPNKHRILHIHKNTPGVLTAINLIFSTNQVNISAQYLQTNSTIGYVVMDVESNHSNALFQALKKIPDTLQCRILY